MFYMFKNYQYALKKSARKEFRYLPVVLLTLPCKGIDSAFEKNITSVFSLDYDNYYINFVVESTDDPAYEKLCLLKDKFASTSKALDVRILIAGKAACCSQKIHNLLCSIGSADDGVEVLAFADSDVYLRSDWLSHLVHPLRKRKCGASTGYRWFVPERNNLASLALSAINAKVAQLLGNTRFNQAWGGSMAIRLDTFRSAGIEDIWQKSLSDDLSLSYAVKKAGMKIVFVPACLVASYEKTTWPGLFEFARRQFLITRVTMPGTWLFAIFGSIYSLVGLWAGAALAIYAAMTAKSGMLVFVTVPATFLASQFFRSILRQKLIVQLLPDDVERMKPAIIADLLGTCIWSWVMFVCIAASAYGRRITWRGIRYRLISPTETVIDEKQ